ncbi:hypothetical protein NDJ29_06290 [Vibrio alginolyticus]|uniref:hypothetical protein n=1 Tax=Vibrio alginolyticus TaxID=663 RepID=UPI002160C508|nr:hypothetical protein [Vibrio alginolyticus]MCS0194403.1 hypothetical protein [Vibrio alginolyticus]
MTVYKIIDNLREFQTICSGPDEIASQLGDFDYFERILLQAIKNQSLQDIWKPVEVKFQDVFKYNSLLPDISLWARTYLVLSPRAYEILNAYLTEHGEFLPANYQGGQWYLYASLTFGQENKRKCVEKIAYGSRDGLDTLVFIDDDVKDKLVFKSRLEGAGTLYCTDKFKALCEQNQLNGIMFSSNLTDPFN